MIVWSDVGDASTIAVSVTNRTIMSTDNGFNALNSNTVTDDGDTSTIGVSVTNQSVFTNSYDYHRSRRRS